VISTLLELDKQDIRELYEMGYRTPGAVADKLNLDYYDVEEYQEELEGETDLYQDEGQEDCEC
jgi:uncharacterized protein YhjY with autotransporter beta-barrel domain